MEGASGFCQKSSIMKAGKWTLDPLNIQHLWGLYHVQCSVLGTGAVGERDTVWNHRLVEGDKKIND